MNIFTLIVPVFLLIVLVIALKDKLNVLQLFTDGVVEGLKTVFKITPYILSITIAITVLQDSGTLEFITGPLAVILKKLKIPQSIVPLVIFRPLSGGASMSVVMDIFKRYGVDSIDGKIASIIMGGTETTFYVTTVLFGSVNIKHTRGVIIAALIADLTAILMAIILVRIGVI